MFTGIVRERGRVVGAERNGDGMRLRISAPETAAGTGIGDSVSVSGCCLTAVAVEAGLEMGGASASLQASSMGASIYRRMGFETIFDYRLYMCPAPEASR